MDHEDEGLPITWPVMIYASVNILLAIMAAYIHGQL